MPQQGPGTKLVLKALRRAFPEIAEKRDREEREEREARENRHESRNGEGEHGQGPAVNPEDARSHHTSGSHSRSGSIRDGHVSQSGSIRDGRASQLTRIREENPSHSGSIRQGQSSRSRTGRRSSVFSNADSTGRESQYQQRDSTRPESRQRRSTHSSLGSHASSRHSTEASVGYRGDSPTERRERGSTRRSVREPSVYEPVRNSRDSYANR